MEMSTRHQAHRTPCRQAPALPQSSPVSFLSHKCRLQGILAWRQGPSRAHRLTSVMVFRAVSEPMLKSEPGTLLETVAGTITMGMQNSGKRSRAADSSSSPRYP